MVLHVSDPDGISEDRGFKALVTSYPVETIEVVVPELLTERGRPVSAVVLQQESALPDLAEPSRFLDVALMATWEDGSQEVILLVEHWSQARQVDLRRVNWYVADLALRHPLAVVYPVVLVTDPGTQTVPERWEMTVAGVTTLALRVQVYRVTAAELPRLRSLQNRVAAILATLAIRDTMDVVDAVIAVLEHMARSPGPLEDVERYLPLVMKFAKMLESDRSRFRLRLEEAGMWNPITEIKEEVRAKAWAEAQAEGRAEGRADASRATVASIRRHMDRGMVTREIARAQLQDLMDTGAITREDGLKALSQLQ
jgi:hypothetical protein